MNQAFFNFDDGDEGRRRRDKGIKLVKSHTPPEWSKKFWDAVFFCIRHGNFTAEDVRLICGTPPNHPNAFSAHWNAAVRRKIIVWTGEFTPTTRGSSHSRGGGLKIYRGTGKTL